MVEAMIASVLVIGRVAIACVANVLEKQLFRRPVDALTLMLAIWSWMTICTAPWWIGVLVTSQTSGPFCEGDWGWMMAACVLEMPGNWMLLRSLQRTDLSVYAPLNSFKPIVSVALAMLLLNEFPTIHGWIGMAIVLIGTCFLTDSHWGGNPIAAWTRLVSHAGVRDRLVAVVLTATASVFLKKGMVNADPWAVLAQWCVLSWLVALLVWMAASLTTLRNQTDQKEPIAELDFAAIKSHTLFCLAARARAFVKLFWLLDVFWIAIALLAMQGMTILLFARIPVGYALSLFQLSGIVSVVLGHRMFGEPHVWRRLSASLIMVIGAIVIIFSVS